MEDVKVIDDGIIEVSEQVTTTVQINRDELRQKKEMLEADIADLQGRLAKIDAQLAKFEIPKVKTEMIAIAKRIEAERIALEVKPIVEEPVVEETPVIKGETVIDLPDTPVVEDEIITEEPLK